MKSPDGKQMMGGALAKRRIADGNAAIGDLSKRLKMQGAAPRMGSMLLGKFK
jgi:hypothetical protein